MTTTNRAPFIGGLLLIIGTTIGGGMLALPVASAAGGYLYACMFLFLCWLIMTIGALCVLEANLWLPRGSHMISMARATLGRGGEVITWGVYLLLLYVLLSAYVSGGTEVFGNLLGLIGLHLPHKIIACLFVGLFGWVIYHSIGAVDYLNRFLMFGKMGIYVLIILMLTNLIEVPNLGLGEFSLIHRAIMIMITSYGFAIIVPSLRTYFQDDAVALRRVIYIGSLIPLICYITWCSVIMGVIPRAELMKIDASDQPIVGMIEAIASNLSTPMITEFFRFFTSVSVLTAFLSVGMSLMHFLADGFKLEKQGRSGMVLALATFAPPMLLAWFYPGAFISALGFAGIFVVLLLLLLPLFMVWRGRYSKHLSGPFTTPGGKLTLCIGMIAGLFLLLFEVFFNFVLK